MFLRAALAVVLLATVTAAPLAAAEATNSISTATNSISSTNLNPEATAKAAFAAAEKAARDAEASVVPLREAMQKADKAYAEARKSADAKRQQATEAKNLAGDPGVKELQQAEGNLAAAAKALAEASTAKPPLDKEAADAKAAAVPLQQSFDAIEKAAREAEAAAKAASESATRLDIEAKRAATQAANLRRAADTAKAALTRAQQSEQNLQRQVETAPQKVAEAEAQRKAADEALATARKLVEGRGSKVESMEKAAAAAEANAKPVSEAEKQKALAEAASRRKAADEAKGALAQVQQNEQQTQAKVNELAVILTGAARKAAEDSLANAKKQVAAAAEALQEVERRESRGEGLEKQKPEEAAREKDLSAARAALAKAQGSEKQAQAKLDVAAKALAEAPAQKKAADEAIASARKQVAAATTAHQAAEQTAQAGEAAAKMVVERAGRSEQQKQQAQAEAAAKRKDAEAAKAALAQAQAGLQSPQSLAAAAAQKAARATAQKNLAEAQFAGAKKQVATATTAAQAAEQAAQAAEKAAEEKKQLAADAAAKRKAAADGPGTIAAAQKAEQQALAQAAAAAKKIADAETQKKTADAALAKAKEKLAAQRVESLTKGEGKTEVGGQRSAVSNGGTNSPVVATVSTTNSQAAASATNSQAIAKAEEAEKAAQAAVAAAAKKLAEAQAEKKAADDALASAKSKVAAAVSASQAAQVAAREFLQLDDTAQQATAIATAQRKLANDAKAALAPKAKASEQAAIKANTAAQTLTRAEGRKKSAEEALDGLKKRIASAKQSHVADEEAAKQAEAAAVPLKADAEKTRAAYLAASTAADEKRSAAEKAKAVVFRLAAARQIASLMESPAPAAPANLIDDLVFAKLNSFGIQPVLCSDAVFVRRAFLDVTGTLPSEQEARSFIQSTDPKKRVALIDQLLERPDHVDYWAMKWSDILRVKAEFPVKVWPNAAQAYHRWIWEAIAQNKPYDTFARELLTSSGSNFRVGPVNFFRAIQDKTPEGIASAVGLALMGTRVQLWPAERRAGMGAFFSQVGYKPTSEWKEEIVFWDPLKSAALPGSTAPGVDSVAKAIAATCQVAQELAQPLSENGPVQAVFPDGTKTTVPPARDPREVFAEWLIRPENPWFGKAVVNRTWAWIMGRGIIHEADDIRDGNTPVNPELLAFLEKELVSSRYNLKHIRRLIFTSTTYQLSPIPKTDRPEARAHFANYLMRRVDAEVLSDAVNHITGSTDLYTSAVPEPFTYIPREMTAVEVADGSITSSFLTLFGRSARGTGMESERVNELASPQWLYMLNSSQMQAKLQGGPRLATLLSSGGKPNEIAEKLYLTVLSRFPTEADLRAVENYTKAGVTKGRDMWMDLAWALINSPEFLFRH